MKYYLLHNAAALTRQILGKTPKGCTCGECASDEMFQCQQCGRLVPWCDGGDSDDRCDRCWELWHEINPEKEEVQ